MSNAEVCCTCATLIDDVKLPYDPNNEKPLAHNRTLECCDRTICATCQFKNPRFRSYCPFCQISTEPSALPAEGLRLPPSYNDGTDSTRVNDQPPAYDSITSRDPASGRVSSTHSQPPQDTRDTIHFLSGDDTLHSLSLAYRVPLPVLRQHNNLFSDSLLAARKFVLIPHTHYNGPSLSNPPDPEEEERKRKLRRWMVATKCADYSVAQLYLKSSHGDLEGAIESFKADEQWEKEHPIDTKGKDTDRQRRRRFGSSLAGQLS